MARSKKLFFCTGLWLVSLSIGLAGQFRPVYSEVSNPEFAEWQAELREEQVLESLAEELNHVLSIPTDVVLTVGECQTPNAFYNPENQSITVCYELISEMSQTFSQAGIPEDELDSSVGNATAFFFYHELGHALIHVLDLPTTGMEEDAVDQLSTYVLTSEAEGGEMPALDGAIAFLLWAQEAQAHNAPPPFWDEHSLNEQRFFNIVCWVYGENPGRQESLVREGLLPEARAVRCPGEWEQIDKSWSRLLTANLKQD